MDQVFVLAVLYKFQNFLYFFLLHHFLLLLWLQQLVLHLLILDQKLRELYIPFHTLDTSPDRAELINKLSKYNFCIIEKSRLGFEEYLDKLDKYMHSEVAAIIVEPIQGEGGDKHFEAQIFHELRALADTYSSMLIFDEVQTGLGATGKMWAYEHFGVVPDMMCFGKKTQVCGFCATDRIDEVKENVFSTSGRINSTWGGNIVDMVRFQYIADAIQKYDLVSNAAQVGGHFMNALSRIDGLHNIRGRGLMIAFDLETTAERDQLKSLLQERMIVLTCGTRSIRLRPTLSFSKADADTACNIIEHSISKLKKG